MKFAAFAIILLAVFNLNNAIALTGSNLTFNNAWSDFWCTISFCGSSPITGIANAQTAISDPTVNITDSGYSPTLLTIKAGSLVKLHLNNTGGRGCTQTFTIPQLGIQQSVPLGTQSDITFTAPSQPGNLAFMCSMGMYRGMFNII